MANPDFEILGITHLLKRAADLAELGLLVGRLPTCNDCADVKCKYRPEWGRPVRYNCPLYVKGDKKNAAD